MELFSDLIATIGKIVGKLRTLPRAERDRYRQVLDETFLLINSALNMVVVRLGDVLAADPTDVRGQIAQLDNIDGWIEVERNFRLCRSLRIALRETEAFASQLAGTVSVDDWDALIGHMQAMLSTEAEVAMFISDSLTVLADAARGSDTEDAELLQLARQVRQALVKERQALMAQEVELLSDVI